MATLTDLPAEHRDMVRRHMDEKTLAKLSPAELRYRCAYAHEVRQRAKGQPEEHYRFLGKHALRVLNSKPIMEHLAEVHRLHELRQMSSSAKRQDEEGVIRSVQGAWAHAIRDEEEANEYPPGLYAAVDMRLGGKPVLGDPELEQVADACIAHARRQR